MSEESPTSKIRELAELEGLVGGMVPEEALRFFARWWQFEVYLREVAYLELRAFHGSDYVLALGEEVLKRVEKDRVNSYMASADLEPMAYLDAGGLMALIERRWELFEETLLPKERWQAAAGLLRGLRNRVSHCRRPHSDDLARLRQLLRDLELGAGRFYGSFASTRSVGPKDGPLGRDWVKGHHATAARLLCHAERQYDTRFRLEFSARPWASAREAKGISGKPGYLWHANWILGSGEIRPQALWDRLAERPSHAERIVHLLIASPFSITATFASIDPYEAIADAIGVVFDALLETRSPTSEPFDSSDENWEDAARDLPAKVQTSSWLSLYDPYTALSVFAA